MLRPGKKFYKHPSLVAAITFLFIALLTVPTGLVLTSHAAGKEDGTVVAYDDFDGKLNLNWNILHVDPTHWSLSKKPGTLTITTQDGTFHRGRTDYKNLFLIDCPTAWGEDFQVTTCILSFNPVAEWNQAGLIFWNDEENYLKLVYEWSLGPLVPEIEAQRVFTVGAETKGGVLHAWFRADQQLENVWLRVIKRGNEYTFHISPDGKSFVPVQSPLRDRSGLFDGAVVKWGDGTVKRVGIFANNGSSTDAPQIDASFDFFEVKGLPARGNKVPAEREAKPAKSLHQAAADGDIEQVKSLISKGADINAKDEDGDTALHIAIDHGRQDVVKPLLDKGADINTKTRYGGRTPLHQACLRGQTDTAELLIAKGADVNAIDSIWGAKPLACAAYEGHKNTVELLLSKGADINHKNRAGNTALSDAAFRGNLDVVEFLIAKGAKVDEKNYYDATPVVRAVEEGHVDTVKLLLAKGADIKETCQGETLLHRGIMHNQRDMVRLLLDKGLKTSPINLAAFFGELETVKNLIAQGTDLNAKDVCGYCPLLCATCGNHRQVIDFLIARGADVNAKDNRGFAPLHHASADGHMDIVELLISKGAEVDAKSKIQSTPLYWASYHGRREVVKLLLDKGANVNALIQAQKATDWTALHQACRNGHIDVAELLIAHGANVNAKTGEGKTPLSLAEDEGRKEVVKMLRKHGAKE